jgi:hypothetical protein
MEIMIILNRQKRTNPAAIMVAMIASIRGRSKITPSMPSTRAAGNEHTTSNPPRIARGLPHPGRRQVRATNVAIGMAIKKADIFPKRILDSFPKTPKLNLRPFQHKLYPPSPIHIN